MLGCQVELKVNQLSFQFISVPSQSSHSTHAHGHSLDWLNDCHCINRERKSVLYFLAMRSIRSHVTVLVN